MEEDKVQSGLDERRHTLGRGLLVAALLGLAAAQSSLATPKHFELPAGDARIMLNRFSEQSDIQLLFDFTQLTGKRSNAVIGDFEPIDALTALMRGIPVDWAFVNDRTLALTLKEDKTSRVRRWWQRTTSRPAQARNGLDQVLIAGSNDLYQPAPVGAELIRLDRIDIQRSGLATTQDFLHTLPQVFGGGPSEDTTLGREAPTNVSRGSGVNLRGLDAGATLVLIDGQRLAPSGTTGLFTDISNIPLSAIDHIDILPDGASARYGADAIGGVVNFVLRSNFTGAETQLLDGTSTGGSLGTRQFSQLLGGHWGDSTTTMLGIEYYDRGTLAASARAQATSNLLPFGGTNFDTPYGSPGTLELGPQTWAVPAGQAGKPPAASELVAGTQNLYDQWVGTYVLPEQQRWSAFGTLRSQVGDGVELFADSLFTNRKMTSNSNISDPMLLPISSSSPFYVNPTGGSDPITLVTGTQAYFGAVREMAQVHTGGVALGLAAHPTASWTFTGHLDYRSEKEDLTTNGLFDAGALEHALTDPDPNTALDPFGGISGNNPATLAAIGRISLASVESKFKIAGVTGEGTLFRTPGGDARLALGAEYRQQSLDTVSAYSDADHQPVVSPSSAAAALSRTVSAGFAELVIPLFSKENSRNLLQRLEVSIGERTENYSDVGHASVPKAGLLWSPTSNLTFRSTWTKSFRPPALPDVVSTGSFSEVISLPDVRSATGVTTALVAAGSNPNLDDEKARTWTVGAELKPDWLPALTFGATYFDTYYFNRIEAIQLEPDVLNQPSLAWLVSTTFTAAQRGAICGQTVFLGPPGECLGSQINAIVDSRLHNVEHLETRGIDLIGKYSLASSFGTFDLALNGTYLLGYSEAKTPGTPTVELLNTQNNPINLRLRGSLSWDRRGFGASAFVNFDNGYKDELSNPNRSVRSWTTIDLQLRYRTSEAGPGFFGNTEIAISAQDLFNSSPPFLNNPVGIGYDQENADLTGRIVSLEVRKHW